MFLERESPNWEEKLQAEGPHLVGASWHVWVQVPCLFQRSPSLRKPVRTLAGGQQTGGGRRGLRIQDAPDTREGQGATHGIPPRQKEQCIVCLFSSIQGNCFKSPYIGQWFCTPYVIDTVMHNELISTRQVRTADEPPSAQASVVLASTDPPRRH